MWPLDRWKRQELLRVGSRAVERWAGLPGAIELTDSQPLLAEAECDRHAALASALRAALASPAKGGVVVVVESAWAPVLRVDTGGVLWRDAQAQALVRHRLQGLFDDTQELADTWAVQVDFRAGEQTALGFAMRERTRRAVADTAADAGIRLAALVPAFVWGLRQLRPTSAWKRGTGWWLWAEQDRGLLARVVSGRVVALNAAVPLSVFGTPAVLVERERVRGGVLQVDEPVSAGRWEPWTPDAAASMQACWLSLSGPGASNAKMPLLHGAAP